MLPGPGSIINIASVAALRGYYPGFVSLQVNYSTAKAGVVGFTRQVAAEYAKEKIRVNAIAPGWPAAPRLRRSGGRFQRRSRWRNSRRRSASASR